MPFDLHCSCIFGLVPECVFLSVLLGRCIVRATTRGGLASGEVNFKFARFQGGVSDEDEAKLVFVSFAHALHDFVDLVHDERSFGAVADGELPDGLQVAFQQHHRGLRLLITHYIL